MLTNTEYSRVNHVPVELPAELEPFAAFTVDLGAVQDITRERGEDGRVVKRTVKRALSHLRGKGVHLWDVTPRRDGMTMTELRKFEAEQAEKDRQARLALYTQRGFAFDKRAVTDPQGGEDEGEDETPEQVDEWTRFFAEDVKPHDRGARRRRLKDYSSFEGFVDAAQ